MPTGLITDFWLAGWGPPNSLVPENIDLVALTDTTTDLLALPGRSTAVFAKSGRATAKLALSGAGINRTAKTDRDVDLG